MNVTTRIDMFQLQVSLNRCVRDLKSALTFPGVSEEGTGLPFSQLQQMRFLTYVPVRVWYI